MKTKKGEVLNKEPPCSGSFSMRKAIPKGNLQRGDKKQQGGGGEREVGSKEGRACGGETILVGGGD